MFSISNRSSSYSRYFWVLLISIAVIRLAVALAVDTSPQEAYYWNYARHPALSYYDHPPMTAWLIFISTKLFGDTAFALHFPALAISILLSILLFDFISGLYDKKIAFWAVLLANSTILFSIGSIITTPDCPLLLFWLLLMISLYRAVSNNSLYWWILAGTMAGAAMISKYTAIFGLIGGLFYLVGSPMRRREFGGVGPYLAVIVAFLIFLPVIIWNYQHDWASFAFQSERRAAEFSGLRFDYFLGFLGVQFAVGGLFLLLFFIYALISAFKNLSDNKQSLFFWFAVPIAVVFGGVSLFHYVKMNWLAPVYLSAVILLARRVSELGGSIVNAGFRISLALSLLVVILVHMLIAVPIIGLGKADPITGWDKLADKVSAIRREMADAGESFVCGYDYKTASQLAFHLADHPEVYSCNIFGENGLAYNYWGDLKSIQGINGVIVVDLRYRYRNERPLTEFFESVATPETLTVIGAGKKVTDFQIYRCYNYKGANP